MDPERLGKYEILERIGEGGFGTVWKGRDPFLKRLVAIKTCTTDSEDLRRRFLREAEIAGGLHHPNIVLVHDFGYDGETPYLVQEFLDGEDLSAAIKRREELAEATRLAWLLDVARGLAHAHERGIVHRDVKPANVRICGNGLAKVMDFGIARLAQEDTRLTKTGTSLGTVSYMAPEQINGGAVDHRADIFSFGVLAYELASYERPFEAETMSRVFYRILSEDPRPIGEIAPPGCSADLERLIRRCLAKEPGARYQSFDEIARLLERLAAGEPLAEALDATAVADPSQRSTRVLSRPAEAARAAASVAATPRSGAQRTGGRSGARERPSGPTGPASATGPTEAHPRRPPAEPTTATAYAPARASKLPIALAGAALLGALAVAGLWLAGGDSGAPPAVGAEARSATAPARPPAAEPEPTASASAPVAAPPTSATAPPSAAAAPTTDARDLERRVAARLREAERLESAGRREAALEAALDALALDPASREARRVVERLAEGPAREPAPAPAVETPAAVASAAPAPATATPATVTAPALESPPATTPAVPPSATALPPAAAPAPAAPAPTVAPAASAQEADRAAVLSTLAAYERAYERLDAAGVARVFPGLSAGNQRDLERAFANYRSLAMEITDCSIELAGDSATAACRVARRFELKVGRADPHEARATFRLSRAGAAWRIDALGE